MNTMTEPWLENEDPFDEYTGRDDYDEDDAGMSYRSHTGNKKTCRWPGCRKEVHGQCAACKRAHYCSEEHMVGDYARHVEDECASCVQHSTGAVFWALEAEVGQSHGDKEEAWEPVDMMHARCDVNGRVVETLQNRDLVKIAGPATAEHFHAREVAPGSRVNSVRAGRRRGDAVPTRVYLSITSELGVDEGFNGSGGGTLQVYLPDHDVASLTGRGTTVHLQYSDLQGRLALPVAAQGSVVVGLEIGNERWQIWGMYNLFEHKETGLSGVWQDVRQGTISATRRALGHEEVVRIRGRDKHGVAASLTFRRMGKASYGPESSYQLQSLSIHVPEIGGHNNEEWHVASEGRFMDERSLSSEEKGLVKALTDLPGDLAMDTEEALMNVYTRYEHPPTDEENRVHIASLVNWLADHQKETSVAFVGGQMHAAPQDTARMQTRLTEIARMRSLLEGHIATLAAEEAGAIPRKNIPFEVMAAIRRTDELIGAYDARKWYARRAETAR